MPGAAKLAIVPPSGGDNLHNRLVFTITSSPVSLAKLELTRRAVWERISPFGVGRPNRPKSALTAVNPDRYNLDVTTQMGSFFDCISKHC